VLQSDNCEIKESYKKHEIIFENKRISFIMPECYSDTYKSKILWGRHDTKWYDTIKTFYSTKNDYNFVEFVIFENDYYDKYSMDSLMNYGIQISLYDEPPMVPFCELKKDRTGHVFELRMSSCYDFLKEESHIPKEDQHCVYSHFQYTTRFDNKFYIYMLETREPIKDFSYAEKKYIIESVRIEEIKQ
jgi:hypothetical protein